MPFQRNRATTPVGEGRLSKSLGAADPRGHRNPQAAQDTAKRLGHSLKVDRRGRMVVVPAKQVAAPVAAPTPLSGPAAATTDLDGLGSGLELLQNAHNQLLQSHGALILTVNSLLESLREARLLEGGPR